LFTNKLTIFFRLLRFTLTQWRFLLAQWKFFLLADLGTVIPICLIAITWYDNMAINETTLEQLLVVVLLIWTFLTLLIGNARFWAKWLTWRNQKKVNRFFANADWEDQLSTMSLAQLYAIGQVLIHQRTQLSIEKQLRKSPNDIRGRLIVVIRQHKRHLDEERKSDD